MTDPVASVATLFDALADSYDQSGVEFFGPVARRLVELARPQPGDRALDLGCGRGAATLPLAAAVGESGRVTAVDISPGMVAATQVAVRRAGLTNTEVFVADGRAPEVDDGFDLAVASLVLFFIPDPGAALSEWVSRVRPGGGRVALSTFGRLDDTTRALDALFDPWLPQGLLDARTSGTSGPFGSDAGMVELMRSAGAATVDTVVEPVRLTFSTSADWQRFSMSTGQRAMWGHVPEAERPGLLAEAGALLDSARQGGGEATLEWQMRYTIGHRAA